MQKLNTFFQSVIKSCSDPEYGRDLMKAKFSFSLKYLALLALIIAVVLSLRATIAIAQFDVEGSIDKAIELYPSELEITFDRDGLSINQALPYHIDFELPSEFDVNYDGDKLSVNKDLTTPNYPGKTDRSNHIITFDSDENIRTVDDFLKSDSYVVVTESKVYSFENSDSRQVNVVPLDFDIQAPFTFDVNTIIEVKNNVLRLPIIQSRAYVYIFAVLIPVFIFFGAFSGNLFIFIFSTLFIYILVKIFMSKKTISFGKLYQIIIHSKTPILLIQSLNTAMMSVVKFRIPPILMTIGFTAWTLVWISKLDDKKVAATTTPKLAK